MHIQQELTEKLSQLKDILSEMKALIEWQKLKAFESSCNPPSQLLFSNDTQQQLSNKYGRYISVSTEIDHILKTNAHLVIQSSIIKELNTLHCQLYYLGTGVRVY